VSCLRGKQRRSDARPAPRGTSSCAVKATRPRQPPAPLRLLAPIFRPAMTRRRLHRGGHRLVLVSMVRRVRSSHEEERHLWSCRNLSDLCVEPSAPDHYGYLSELDLFDDMPCWANQNSGARARRKDRFPSPSSSRRPRRENGLLRSCGPPLSSAAYPGDVADTGTWTGVTI
jgi:hypothetical protein